MIDFGGAAWIHPFLAMIMMTIECRYRWSVPYLPDALNLDHPVLHRTVDGYLEAWSDASIDEWRRTMTDAFRVGRCDERRPG